MRPRVCPPTWYWCITGPLWSQPGLCAEQEQEEEEEEEEEEEDQDQDQDQEEE